jgi:hypothetical protein
VRWRERARAAPNPFYTPCRLHEAIYHKLAHIHDRNTSHAHAGLHVRPLVRTCALQTEPITTIDLIVYAAWYPTLTKFTAERWSDAKFISFFGDNVILAKTVIL